MHEDAPNDVGGGGAEETYEGDVGEVLVIIVVEGAPGFEGNFSEEAEGKGERGHEEEVNQGHRLELFEVRFGSSSFELLSANGSVFYLVRHFLNRREFRIDS